MKALRFVAAGFVLIALASVLWELYSAPRRDAVRQVLRLHEVRPVSRGFRPVLYYSYFPKGSPYYAEDCGLYPDGYLMHHRVVWDWGRSGVGSRIHDAKVERELMAVEDLPPGMGKFTDVPLRRLLVMSHQSRDGWVTRYYDRDHLPVQVSHILQITDEKDRH